jgi:hypothetical protein
MKFNQQAVLNASVDEVDLEEWLFTLSDSEYQAPARGHRGAGVFTEDGVRGSINVESIGGTLMVQHYHAVSAQPERVAMFRAAGLSATRRRGKRQRFRSRAGFRADRAGRAPPRVSSRYESLSSPLPRAAVASRGP